MTTTNNAAALERLEQKWREEAAAEWTHCQNKELSEWVRDRCYGQHNRLLSCADELAALRATLTQPDALTGGDKRLTACIEGIGLAKMALMAGDPVKARERLDAISDRLDALTVRIAHKGPSDFPNHQCPAESSAAWNACCMEHERVLAGKVPILTTTALTSQPSGEAVAWEVRVYRKHAGRPHLDHWSKWQRIDPDCYDETKASGCYYEYDTIELRELFTHPSADAPGVAVDEVLRGVCMRMLTFENSEHVPNVMFQQLRAALAPKPEGEL